MKTLAFDTTTNFCSVALLDDRIVQNVFSESLLFGQSEKLIVQINDMLENKQLSIADMDLIAVCTGPGSFTGVRSSIAAARAFGIACPNVTLSGVDAFDIYAASLKDEQKAPCNAVLIETKRDDFYVAYYDNNLKRLQAPKTAFKDEILRDLDKKDVTLIGDGVERFLSLPCNIQIKNTVTLSCPPVENLGFLAVQRYQDHKTLLPKPFYLKSADICVK